MNISSYREKTYLFELEAGKNHLELLGHLKIGPLTSIFSAIQKIYRDNNLPAIPVDDTPYPNIDLTPYQSSIEDVSRKIRTSPEAKQRKIQQTIDLICAGPLVGTGCLTYKFLKQHYANRIQRPIVNPQQ